MQELSVQKQGKFPGRLAYPVWSLVSIFSQCVSNHKTKPIQLDFSSNSYPKIERLESMIDGPTCRENLIF